MIGVGILGVCAAVRRGRAAGRMNACAAFATALRERSRLAAAGAHEGGRPAAITNANATYLLLEATVRSYSLRVNRAV